MKSVTLSFVLGTRPEIIKVFPLILEAASQNIAFEILHIGQHFDAIMRDAIWNELKLPKITQQFELKHLHAAHDLGLMQSILAEYYLNNPKDNRIVLVQGDTNSTLAGALVANKMGFKLVHVEAGCRSGLMSQPEEINRILVDHLSTLNIAMDKTALRNLSREKLAKNCVMLPNTVFAAIHYITSKSTHSFQENKFRMITVHRAENADKMKRLKNILGLALELAKEKPLLWVLHPRTRKTLMHLTQEKFQLLKNINENMQLENTLYFLEPQSYAEFTKLLRQSSSILSDSGGVVDEAVFLGKHLICLRSETEYEEVVGAKRALLLSPEHSIKFLKAKTKKFEQMTYPKLSQKEKKTLVSAPKKIIDTIKRKLAN